MPEITGSKISLDSSLRWYRRGAFLLGVYALVGGIVSLAAWAADIPRLADWNGDGITIQPNAAVAVIAASLAILLLSLRLNYATLLLGIFVTFVGLSSVFQLLTNIDLGINTLLLFEREWGREGLISPGLMSTPAAASWTLLGFAITLVSLSGIRAKAAFAPNIRLLAVGLAITTLVISSLSITGYLHGAEILYTMPRYTVIALQTATFILAVSLGVIFRITDVGPMRILGDESSTGLMFRRIVPMMIAVPILLGLLELIGERAGFFDRAFGIAARTLAEAALLLALLWWTGRTVVNTEARKTAMFQNALDCIISIDHRGYIIEFNPAAEMTFGYSREEALGRELAELIIPPSLREAHRRGMALYMATGEGRVIDRRIEVNAMREDGSEFPVELSITRIRLDGQPQFTAYLRDITERKSAEQAMENARLELEERVTERTAELSVLNEALERSNHELEQFASVASHDLQEPLRKIQAFGDRLQTKYAAGLGEQGEAYVDRMLTSAARMRGLIDSLLDLSRITTKASPFVPVDLAAIARDCVSDLEARIYETNGTVDLGSLPMIDADPVQMHQLFLNLIGNGLKFKKPDEPPVVQVESRILKGSRKKAEMCEITVRDNGIGFEEIYLDRIFEVFQRLHGRHEYEGTGMGLAICRKIAERHGGSITATAELDVGATFLVTLPVKQEETK